MRLECDKKKKESETLEPRTEKCKKCDYKTANKAELKGHIQSLHEENRYKCDKCDYNAAEKTDLKLHIQSIHEGERYKCDICDYKATRKTYLETHIQSTHEDITSTQNMINDSRIRRNQNGQILYRRLLY